MKKLKLFLSLWLPVVLWCGLLFYLSSIPNLKTAENPFWDEIIRSGVHFAFYTILYILFFRALNFQRKKKTFSLPLILAVLYSLSDEIHQSFVPTRTFQIRDFLINFLGALAGGLILWFFFPHLRGGRLRPVASGTGLRDHLAGVLRRKWSNLTVLVDLVRF